MKVAARFAHNSWIRLLLVVVMTVATAQGALAGVVYRWIDVGVNPITGPIQGELVVDSAIWAVGGGVTASYSGGVGPKPIPGIQSFSLQGRQLGMVGELRLSQLGVF